MIPVMKQPEPSDFDGRVKQPGNNFLRGVNTPVISWKNRDYWTRVLVDLHKAYNGICAYSAHYIPYDCGAATVDHFVPKSEDNTLAYEWWNYRLASRTMNINKREFRDVLDPFEIGDGWFSLDFPSIQIKPGDAAPDNVRARITATITRLKLNNEVNIISRLRWIKEYRDNNISLDFLRRCAPFISSELERQGCLYEMSNIFRQ